jgi:hypothetical protein
VELQPGRRRVHLQVERGRLNGLLLPPVSRARRSVKVSAMRKLTRPTPSDPDRVRPPPPRAS